MGNGILKVGERVDEGGRLWVYFKDDQYFFVVKFNNPDFPNVRRVVSFASLVNRNRGGLFTRLRDVALMLKSVGVPALAKRAAMGRVLDHAGPANDRHRRDPEAFIQLALERQVERERAQLAEPRNPMGIVDFGGEDVCIFDWQVTCTEKISEGMEVQDEV